MRGFFNTFLFPAIELGSNKSQLEEHPDLISQLPNEILLHILSFLGIQSAGQTSILSKRWRFVWSSTPVLTFDQTQFAPNPESPASIEKFIKFVDTVLSLHDGSCIQEFALRWHHGFKTSNTAIWLSYAVDRNVRFLYLDIRPSEYFSLPDSLFYCQSLEFFALLAPSEFIPENEGDDPTARFTYSIIQLPNGVVNLSHLRTIHLLYLTSLNNLLGKLVSDCPILEDLSVIILMDNIEICAPKLKRLTLNCSDQSGHSIIRICAPRLVHFTCYFLGIPQFLFNGNFPDLKVADIYIPKKNQDNSNDGSKVVNILQSISNVESLQLRGAAIHLLMKQVDSSKEEVFPIFRNLVWMMISMPFTKYNIEIVIKLLQNCPKLAYLAMGNPKRCKSVEVATKAEDDSNKWSYKFSLDYQKESEIVALYGYSEELHRVSSLLRDT